MNKAALAAGGLLALGLAAVATPAYANDKLPICHSGSGANWTFISPDANGYNGHQNHDLDVYGLTEAECLAKNAPEPPAEPVYTAHEESKRWLLPESWDKTITPTYQVAIFPQTPLVGDLLCDRWSQDDVYGIDNQAEQDLFDSLDDDGFLTMGEDGSIYKSHVFTYGGDCAEVPPPSDEPTDEPTVTPVVTTPPLDTTPTSASLPLTGTDSWLWLALGGLVVLGGAALTYKEYRTKS